MTRHEIFIQWTKIALGLIGLGLFTGYAYLTLTKLDLIIKLLK